MTRGGPMPSIGPYAPYTDRISQRAGFSTLHRAAP